MKQKEAKVNGIVLAGRYCLTPARQKLCTSKEGDFRAIRSYLMNLSPENRKRAREAMLVFPVMPAYLRAIAKASGITDLFDKRVVEAYYIGNELTKSTPLSATVAAIAESFVGKGILSEQEMETRAMRLPKTYKPHHNFHIFCFGSVMGGADHDSSGPMIPLLEQCQIGWGKVVRAIESSVILEQTPVLVFSKSGVELKTREQPLVLEYDIETDPPVKQGDWVTTHWGRICQVINESQCQTLQKHTLQAIADSNLWGE